MEKKGCILAEGDMFCFHQTTFGYLNLAGKTRDIHAKRRPTTTTTTTSIDIVTLIKTKGALRQIAALAKTPTIDIKSSPSCQSGGEANRVEERQELN